MNIANLILSLILHQLKVRHAIKFSYPLLSTGLELQVMTASGSKFVLAKIEKSDYAESVYSPNHCTTSQPVESMFGFIFYQFQFPVIVVVGVSVW